MTIGETIDLLTLKNRAYNLLYCLGEKPESIATLSAEETYRLINLAKEVYAGDRSSYFHRMVANHVPPHQLRYVVTGGAV